MMSPKTGFCKLCQERQYVWGSRCMSETSVSICYSEHSILLFCRDQLKMNVKSMKMNIIHSKKSGGTKELRQSTYNTDVWTFLRHKSNTVHMSNLQTALWRDVTCNSRMAACLPQTSSYICGNKIPTRCNRGFYCRSYCLLNMFWAPLCPSSGAQGYYTVVAACGISCCSFQVVGRLWSWRFMCPVCRMLQHPANRTHNPIILLSSWWWA